MIRAGLLLFVVCVAAGAWLDRRIGPPAVATGVLAADLHVHPFPGDGALTPGALRREAGRRGLDVIAVTAHNNRLALDLDLGEAGGTAAPIVLPGQEVTAPTFHLIAVGIDSLVDWRLPVEDVIDAVHAQGGVAIAAHPVPLSWRETARGALAGLDGVEVAHPLTVGAPQAQDELRAFFSRVRDVNPSVAPIGSSDFHVAGPIGLVRTYVLTADRTPRGVLDAVRAGRTVARAPDGELFGAPEHVAAVRRHLDGRGTPSGGGAGRLAALGALLGLALIAGTVKS